MNEKKKKKPPTLIVRFPLCVYLSAPAKTLMSLVLRLKSSKQVPSQWTLVENDGVILLHKLVQSAGITYVVSIQDGFLWSLRIGEEKVGLDSCELPHIICSAAEVLNLLCCVDNHTFCAGNADLKFGGLIQSHKGCFKNADAFCRVMSEIFIYNPNILLIIVS